MIAALAALVLSIALAGCAEDGGPVAADGDDAGSLIGLALEDVVSVEDGSPAALLRTATGGRVLIPVDRCQAVNLYVELYEPDFARPLAAHLFAALAGSLGFDIDSARLSLAAGDSLAAAIHLEGSGLLTRVPATPGDALAIAQYRSASILATVAVVAEYAQPDTTAKPSAGDASWADVPVENPLSAPKPSQTRPGLTDMRVVAVAQTVWSGLVIVLVDEGQDVVLPIFVDTCQGLAVHAGLHQVDSFANQSQILIVRLLEGAGAGMADVHVVSVVDGVFVAQIGLQHGPRRMAVDCRPSDGIALAMLTDAPIRVARPLVDAYGEDPALYADLLGSP